MLQFDIYGITDVGRKRPRNEDQFLIATLGKTLEVSQSSLDLEDQSRLFGNTQGRILLVADGMGGHAAGDRASYVVTCLRPGADEAPRPPLQCRIPYDMNRA